MEVMRSLSSCWPLGRLRIKSENQHSQRRSFIFDGEVEGDKFRIEKEVM